MRLAPARDTLTILYKSSPGRDISCSSDPNWLPRFGDLTPMDFLLWGILKTQVYTNKPTTTQ